MIICRHLFLLNSLNSKIQNSAINTAFSHKALIYDDYCANNAAVVWSRAVIRRHVLGLTAPGSAMLELNAGTGDDARFFVQHGRHVHATDLAEGMIAAIEHKQKQLTADTNLGNLSVQQLSFTQLDQINPMHRPAQGYDVIFSNFGGLNCCPDLTAITRHLPTLLRHNGYVVWVIMPPICPWELAQAVRGQFKTAFRRLHRHGTLAHVEGAYFRTHYFSPNQVLHALGPQFALHQLQAIGLFSPPSFLEAFPQRFPRLFHWLCRQDENVGRRWPFNRMGDYVMLTAQYTHV